MSNIIHAAWMVTSTSLTQGKLQELLAIPANTSSQEQESALATVLGKKVEDLSDNEKGLLPQLREYSELGSYERLKDTIWVYQALREEDNTSVIRSVLRLFSR